MAARTFGATWWGRAWVGALEHRSGIDPNRLSRGRTYARHDRVARLEIEPGRITALVRGSRVLPYQVEIRVPTFDDDQWDRVVSAIAGRAAHAAALLDGELEAQVLDDVRAVGIDLLPGPGDLSPRCSCPDWGDPCKHAAAVAYLVADALDDDPFVLFTLRGRSRDQVLQAIRRHRQRAAGSSGSSVHGGDGGETESRSGSASASLSMAATNTGAGPGDHDAWDRDQGRDRDRDREPVTAAMAVEDPGIVARDAWAERSIEPPHRRELPAEPGAPAAWPSDPPDGAPFTASGLTELAADAARRAWLQLADGMASQLDLSLPADLARRAADRLDRDVPLTDLGLASAIPAGHLALQAAGWRHGGAAGVTAVDEALWRPTDELVEAAIDAFEAAGVDVMALSIRSNRFSTRDVQLRVTTDGRWWRYEKRGRTWELVEPPADSPADLLTG
ncbi:MAG: hypothetical protein JWM89_3786 [Acidimicrobiales bacterium]|nr:hypothetical protein [Acidimicrobiales bacterium]